MGPMYYIGPDVHRQKISYCVKDIGGKIYAEGWIPATRFDLDRWMKTLPQPWSAALEATMFSGWIYDHLKLHAAELKVAHPLMLRAIAAAKKKNDRIDAHKICDCLRCDFLPECYMAPTAIRKPRRTLRYRNLLVRQKLGLPDLEHAKSAVLVSLRSPESQRSYRRSIEDFVCWYCSEPRLSFNKTVVARYRIHLEDKQLAPGTINVRLAAVRRLAYEAADTGLLSPDLAAGIRHVKGAKKLGMRLGN